MSESSQDRDSKVQVECLDPILRVEDMARSVRYYVEVLGFKQAEWGGEDFTRVSRDRGGIYLCRGGQGLGKAWVWMGVGNARKYHDEIVVRGAKIVMPLTNYPWALEFRVEDPDGNVLRLGSEPE